MDKLKILLTVLCAILYIYLGEIYKFWSESATIKLHGVTDPINMRWFVIFAVNFIKNIVLISVVLAWCWKIKIIRWFCSILLIFVVLDFCWLLWNFQNDRGTYYFTIYYSLAIADTLFFARYWKDIFFGRKATLKKA